MLIWLYNLPRAHGSEENESALLLKLPVVTAETVLVGLKTVDACVTLVLLQCILEAAVPSKFNGMLILQPAHVSEEVAA